MEHLALRDRGDLDRDLAENYAAEVVMLSDHGVDRGLEGVRASALRLFESLGPSTFRFIDTQVEGRFAFLAWTARSATRRIDDGADSFVIEDGRIVMQSVHYTVHDDD